MDLDRLSPVPLQAGPHEFLRFSETYKARESVLLVTSDGMLRRRTVEPFLQANRQTAIVRTVGSNPGLDEIEALLEQTRRLNIGSVVAVGGGSVLDTGKILAVLLDKANSNVSLREVLRDGKDFVHTRLGLVCIPTTSGTGAEVTPFATVWDKEKSKKYSFASSSLEPDRIVLDPTLTVTAPYDVTIDCALDACSHAMESLWNRSACPESIALAQQSLRLFVAAFQKVSVDLNDLQARTQMQQASFLAGLSIRITRTALAHSISYPITLHYGVPHGLACSFTLPAIAEAVSAAGLWPETLDRDLIDKVLEVLNGIDLYGRLGKYCTPEQVRALTGEMFTKGRADNFVLPIEEALQTVL